MSKRANPTVIGAFVVGALALALFGVATLGGLQIFKKELPFVMFFDGDLGGLEVGAPVQIRGVKIGAVTKIRLFANSNSIGVYVNIDPSLLPKSSAVRQDVAAVEDMIKKGLRAQLKVQSFLTNQLLIYLDMFPKTPPVLVGLDPEVREIPTVPTTLARIRAQLEKFLDSLGNVKLEEVLSDVTLAMKSAKNLMAAPELMAAVVSANAALQQADKTLKRLDAQLDALVPKTEATLAETREFLAETREFLAETRKVLANVDAEIGPLSASIRGAGDAAQGTLRTVDRAVDGDSRLGYEALRTLRDVAEAARSLKALADYLERHPDALLRGKGGPDGK
jgi:paraquat-inducible protein B